MKEVNLIKKRRQLMEEVHNNSIVVMFSGKPKQRSGDQDFDFSVDRNFFYVTGLQRYGFALVMYKKNDKLEEVLFIEEPDSYVEKWLGKRLRKEEAEKISGIKNIKYTNEFEKFFNYIVMKNSLTKLYADLERREFGWDETKAHKFVKEIRTSYPELKIYNIHRSLVQMRMIKSQDEVEQIKKAIAITNEGIKNMMNHSKPGMKEYQLEAYFDFSCKTLGAKQLGFKTIAASGENGTVLHYDSNDSEMKDKDLILFDLGAEWNNYSADISRTFPVNGKFTERQKLFYNIVLKAMDETIKAVKPGIQFRELNEVTKKVLAHECKKIGLIKKDEELSKYYFHGVSHSLGLNTHDVFEYDSVLKEGMVLTIEPGIYVKEEGIGIRIEDDVLVTEEGCENLAKDVIKKPEEIEAFMKKTK